MIRDVGLFMLPEAEALIREVCAAEGVDPVMLIRLLEIEQKFTGMARRRGILEAIDAVLADKPEAAQ